MRSEPPLDDSALGRHLATTRAESFGPYFSDRVMRRVAAESRPRTGLAGAAGIWTVHPRLVSSLALAFVVVGLSWWIARPSVFVAPVGSPLAVELPDGSRVTLAPGSTLRQASFRFSGERRVSLSGEAFFEVARGDAEFSVSTQDATVTVTGTRFNVRSWTGAGGTEVALVEGSVLLRPAGAPADGPALAIAAPVALALDAGDIARVGPDGLVRHVDPGHTAEQAASWRDGSFAVSDRPLEAFLDELERRYDIRLEADPAVTRDRTVTYMNPGSPHVEEVLDAVSFALGLRYARTADGWTVVAADTSRHP